MSWEQTINESVANTAAMMTEVNTRLTAMGWTLDDDQSGGSPPYYVFKSTGEATGTFPIYIRIQWSNTADTVQVWKYLHWDNGAQSGTVKQPANTTGRIFSVDDDASFYVWIYGNKDQFYIVTKIGATYDYFCCAYLYDIYGVHGTLQGAVTSGSDKVLTLAAGEADDFVVGLTYQICGSGSGEGRENPAITVVTSGSNQITVDSLVRGYSASSVIGMRPCNWMIGGMIAGYNNYCLDRAGTGTGDSNTTCSITSWITASLQDPNPYNQLYALWPVTMEESGTGLHGVWGQDKYCMRQDAAPSGAEDTLSVGSQDTGTATAGGASTITDSGATWNTDAAAGNAVVITGGTGIGQIRTVSVVDSDTQITVSVAWATTPDSTSEYTICNKAYRLFAPASTPAPFAVFEGGTI